MHHSETTTPDQPSGFSNETAAADELPARPRASAPDGQVVGEVELQTQTTDTASEDCEQQAAGEAPRLVTRGESQWIEFSGEDGESYIASFRNKKPILIKLSKPKPDGIASAAIVDYLNCSFPFSYNQDLTQFFSELFAVLGKSFAPATDRGRGIYGYTNSFALGESKALFAFGGNNGTGFLSFCGEACHQIPNWHNLVNYLADVRHAHITRWDGAYDDFQGVRDVNEALKWYQEGLFTNGGRKPAMDQRGNWIEPDGRGRTLYIGSSENGKLLRVYEKGMQLGIPWHPWVRFECQLGNRDRIIPWEAVLEPGKYLAGSYPKALGWISEQQSRIRTLQKTASISYEVLTHWASIGYGKLINLMVDIEGSPEKVIEKLRREGLPDRLNLPVPASPEQAAP